MHRRPPRVSIALKTSVLYTVLFGAVIAAVVGVMTWALSSRISRYQKLERISSFAADRISHGGRNFDFESFSKINNVYLEIRSREGREGKTVTYGGQPKNGVRYDETVRRVEQRPGSEVVLRVVDLEKPGIFDSMTLSAFLAILVGMLAAAAFFGAKMMYRMMRPVKEMTRTAQKISASDLSQRIEPGRSHDELRELAETFNGMLSRIETAYNQQRQFVSDASHELRTPLSVISGYANILRRWGAGDKAVYSEAVEKIIEETNNMQQLVESLLFLARADRQTQPIHKEPFSAGGLMEEIAKETCTVDSEHTVETDISPGITLTADRALIKQAVRAVVENSTKFTPAGGKIRLSCFRAGGCVILSIEDDGEGIAEKDLPHIFDRFYKADTSRVRGGKSSSGLGLSIVKWIAEHHGGKIRVISRLGKGTRTEILLPGTLPALPEKAGENS